MTMNTERDGAALVIRADGRIDSSNAGEAERVVLALIEQGENRIVLDLHGLDYISSAGLRVVLMAAKRLHQNGGAFALCGLRDEIREVFRISGFLNILTVCGDRPDAIAHVSS